MENYKNEIIKIIANILDKINCLKINFFIFIKCLNNIQNYLCKNIIFYIYYSINIEINNNINENFYVKL